MNLGPTATKKKPEPPKPVDEKKDKMKNAFFAGIQDSSGKKDNSDSDEDEQKKDETKAEPAGDMNLLDFDAGPSANTTTETSNTTVTAGTGNLLDDMFDTTPATTNTTNNTNTASQGATDLLSGMGFGTTTPVVNQAPVVQIKYQGIAGFTTAQFGQTWMGLNSPGSEQKITVNTPASMSMGGDLPQIYS